MRLVSASITLSLFAASTAYAQTAPTAPTAPTPVATPAPAVPPSPVAAPPATSDTHLDLVTLKILRDRGQISAADYESAIADMHETTGREIAEDAPTFVLGKFSTTVYGQFKGDMMLDSTQSFSDLMGNNLVQRPSGELLAPPPAPQITYAGEHPRAQFSIHDSRIGFRFRGPESASGVRAGGLLEMDFFGTQPSTATEASTFDSSLPRLRHAYFKFETPVVDLLVGQTWHVFGWQNVYHPASVEAQGLPGELYGRTMQIRLSKTVATSAVTFEAAIAALRPPERDSAFPQGEGGLRFAINKWTGMMTNGATGTGLQPASIAITGNARDVVIPEMKLLPSAATNLAMASFAVNVFLPIIPATKDHKDNALSIHGEVVDGQGSADLYTGLTGGLTFPSLPNTTGLNPAPTYPQDIDNGIVAFDRHGNLHPIQWTTFIVGAQYYLPFTNGHAFLAGNYAHLQSANIADYTQSYGAVAPNPQNVNPVSSSSVVQKIEFVDGLLMVDVARGVRIGAEYAVTLDHFVDGPHSTNQRLQGAGMFIF